MYCTCGRIDNKTYLTWLTWHIVEFEHNMIMNTYRRVWTQYDYEHISSSLNTIWLWTHIVEFEHIMIMNTYRRVWTQYDYEHISSSLNTIWLWTHIVEFEHNMIMNTYRRVWTQYDYEHISLHPCHGYVCQNGKYDNNWGYELGMVYWTFTVNTLPFWLKIHVSCSTVGFYFCHLSMGHKNTMVMDTMNK